MIGLFAEKQSLNAKKVFVETERSKSETQDRACEKVEPGDQKKGGHDEEVEEEAWGRIPDDDLQMELAAPKVELAALKRKHRRLKRYRQCKRASTLTAVDDEIVNQHTEMNSKDAVIRHLESKILLIEETVEMLQCGSSGPLQKEGKPFSPETRMLVYDAIVNRVSSRNMPILLHKFAKRSGLKIDSVPHRTTVEVMARELGVVSDLQAAELLLANSDLTHGFDATTQEGVHINSVHITSKVGCNVIAIDRWNCAGHINDSVNRLAEVYSAVKVVEYEACRRKMIATVANTLTDRVTVNHATIVRMYEMWGKIRNELNCHLHPFDTIASSTRSTLK